MIQAMMDSIRGLWAPKRPTGPLTPTVIPASVHRIDPHLVSSEARRTCENLHAAGYKAYIVGGAVRDLLLGLRPKDFDVATDATPEQVKRCQRRAMIIGRRFRLVHVMFGREIIECSTFRALDGKGQRKDERGRVVSDNVFGEMWEDATRRDFTLNALYYDPSTQEVLDYHGGYQALEDKVVRMIGDPKTRYREDPVRMLRAVRIASKAGFEIEKATRAPIQSMAPLLEHVPESRLFDEFIKLLVCGQAVRALEDLKALGLTKALMPSLRRIFADTRNEAWINHVLSITDHRVAIGRGVSIWYLIAALLWPRLEELWKHYESTGMTHQAAFFIARQNVLDEESRDLPLQRFMKDEISQLWQLQLNLERRTGGYPKKMINHPRYRAAWDFLTMRAPFEGELQVLSDWWATYVEADEETQSAMVDEAQREARSRGSDKTGENAPKKRRRPRRRKKPSNAKSKAES